jgi:hypothetical protein
MKMRKVMTSASVLALATPLLFMSTASQANAAVSLTVKPAVACTSAEIIYSENIMSGSQVVGNVQLKYSPVCRGTWARVVSYLSFGSDARIQSNNIPSLYATCVGSDVPGTGCNTAPINDAGMTSFAEGTVTLDLNGDADTYLTPSF